MTSSSVRPRRPNKRQPTADPNDAKAWIVERLTAWLFESPVIEVLPDVWISTTEGEDKRQIDVLIRPPGSEDRTTWTVIECKNYDSPIEVNLIDEFYGALHDIGVPTSQGYFVAVKGFSKGAKRRARGAGITLLTLTGIETVKRLAAEVFAALQSVVFLLADVARLFVGPPIDGATGDESLVLRDAHGDRASIPDLLWTAWGTDLLPSLLGRHVISVEVPDTLYREVNGERHPIETLSAVIDVTGYVHTIEGEAHEHHLVNEENQTLAKYGARAVFTAPDGEYTLTPVGSEEELQRYIESHQAIHVWQRVRLPRICYLSAMYWPPSDRVWRILQERQARIERGEPLDPVVFAQVEGTRINEAWHPVRADYRQQMESPEHIIPSVSVHVESHWLGPAVPAGESSGDGELGDETD